LGPGALQIDNEEYSIAIDASFVEEFRRLKQGFKHDIGMN